MVASCHGGGLAVRLAFKLWGAHVGNPDLNRAQSLSAEPTPVLPDAILDARIFRWCHVDMLHVTKRMYGSAD